MGAIPQLNRKVFVRCDCTGIIISSLYWTDATAIVHHENNVLWLFYLVRHATDNYLSNLAIAYVAAILLWALNRMCHAIVIGEEYVPAGAKKVAPKKAAPTAKKGNAFTNYVKKKVAFGDGSAPTNPGQVYHISYHDRKLKTWKVKTENAGRALKVFPTQKEAIDFANACVKKNGGSIRIHSMVGRIRKEW